MTPCPLHSTKQARPGSGLCLGCEAILRQPGLSGEARARAREATSRDWLKRYAPHQLCLLPEPSAAPLEPSAAPLEPSAAPGHSRACRVHPERGHKAAGLCQSCMVSLYRIEKNQAGLPANGTASRQALILCDPVWRARHPHLSELYALAQVRALGAPAQTDFEAPVAGAGHDAEVALPQIEGVLELIEGREEEAPTLAAIEQQIETLEAQRESLTVQLGELHRARTRLVAAEALLRLHPPELAEVEEICPEQVYAIHLAYASLRAALAANLREAS